MREKLQDRILGGWNYYRVVLEVKAVIRYNFPVSNRFKGPKWLHADGITTDKQVSRVVFSFGPQYHPLNQTQVELAIEEARNLIPKPNIVILAFQFDPEGKRY